MITSDQLKDVVDRVDALYKYLNIDQKKVEFEEEQLRTQAPDFWEDVERAQEQMKKVKSIEKWIVGYNNVKQNADELQLAFDFYKEELVTELEVDDDYKKTIKAIEDLELMNMLRQEEDPMDCVLKINSGAGGTESQDWAQMLMRMYMRWAEAHGYKVTISNLQEGEEAGIKSVTMEIEGGEYAYGFLKSENGVHRLVRVSPFNAQGKRMTSFASVFVSPLVDETIEVYVDPARVSWDTFRSSGAGVHLYPLSFYEFLNAIGEKKMVDLLQAKDWTMLTMVRAKFEERLRQYYFVGGMPAAVLAFVNDGDLNKVRTIQKSIIEAYERDFSKHAPAIEVPRIRMVWHSIPSQLSKENRKFIYGMIKEGARAKDFERSPTSTACDRSCTRRRSSACCVTCAFVPIVPSSVAPETTVKYCAISKYLTILSMKNAGLDDAVDRVFPASVRVFSNSGIPL